MPVSRRIALQGIAGLLTESCLQHHRAEAGGSDLTLFRIAEGVYCFRGEHALMSADNMGAICNISVFVGNDATAVVDSGGSVILARKLIAAIGKITDRPIRYLINTHMHPDHVFGNAAFRDVGATIVGHRNLPRALAGREEVYLSRFRKILGEQQMQGVEIIPPDRLVSDTTELDLGGRKLVLKAWQPAHTDNDLTVFDAQSQTLVAGDLVFMDHIPTLDGSLLGWTSQLDQLAAITAINVVPGHGPVPSPWPAAILAEKRYFEALLRDMRQAIARGQPLSAAVKHAAMGERMRWQLFDEFNERNAAAAFAELEWE